MVKLEVSGPAGPKVIVRDGDGKVLMPDPLFKQFEHGVFCKSTLAGDGVDKWSQISVSRQHDTFKSRVSP
jgi:hypothetical protein